MQRTFIDMEIVYDGTQLRSHWIHETTGIAGNCIAAFIGGADVPLSNMVDLVDVRDGKHIFSERMLHFIVEHFDCDLPFAIARQRILVAIAVEELARFAPSAKFTRSGNDIYSGGRKLSVSIATASPVSTLIHFAMNISSRNTPVPTIGLEDVKVETLGLANSIMKRYEDELNSMAAARCKVRSVK
jgi:hypothetical protein